MKKKLLFISLFAFGAVNAQFTDDIESYSLGPIHSGHWSSWSGNPGAEDGIVSNYRASSGTQSIFIGNGGSQDCILDLVTSTGGSSNITAGQWTVEFNLYIPSDSAAYYNFQEVVPIGGGSWGFEIFFGDTTSNNGGVNNGVGALKATGATPTQFSFPNDTWFTITHYIDVDNDLIDIRIDGTSIYSGSAYTNDATGQPYGALAGLDFFSASNTNNFYIDDVNFTSGYSNVDDVIETTQVSVYPNPVTDVLYINAAENMSMVTVYDMMGKTVRTLTPNALNLTIDTAELPAGAYMVKVDMGETSKIVKVIK
jgi:hypothetical protein